MAEATAAVDTFKAFAIVGSDGSRMLVANEPTAASAASATMSPETAARVDVSFVSASAF